MHNIMRCTIEMHNRNAQYYEVHNITPVTEPAADRRVTLHLYYLFRQNIRNSGKKYILLLFALFLVDDFRFPWGGCNTLTRLKAESKGVSGLRGDFCSRQNEALPLIALFLERLRRLQRFCNHQGPRRWQQQKINQCIPKEIRDALLRNDSCCFGDWNVQI